MRKMRTWRECLIEQLADRKSAIAYLQAILEDYQIYKSPAVVQRSLLTVVEAQGGIVELAKRVNMDPQVFSKVVSNEDTPLIEAFGIVLKALGYQLSIQPMRLEDRNLDEYTNVLKGQKASAHVMEN